MDSDENYAYDAFISYSRSADEVFAPRFQQRLEAFARRNRGDGRRRDARALRVFRDDANLSAHPDLWQSIEEALASARWFVLLASPEAAGSSWVGKELAWWLENRSRDRILIGLTHGKLEWSGSADGGNALHPVLRGSVAIEPRWIDLREISGLAELDDDDPRVQEALADFAAPIRGVDKDVLIGEHTRRRKHERRRLITAVAVFAVLFLLAGTAGVIAYRQQKVAEDQARIATARLLASTAVKDSSVDAGRAQLLAAEGYRLHRDAQTEAALFQVVTGAPGLVRQHTVPAPVTSLATTPGGTVVAGTSDGRLVRWESGTGATSELKLGGRPVSDVAVSTDGTVAAADGARAVVWRPGTEPIDLTHDEPGQIALSPKGQTVAVLSPPQSRAVRLATFESGSGGKQREVALSDGYWDGLGLPDEDTIAVTGGAGVWHRLNVADLSVKVRQDELMAPANRGISTTSSNGAFTGFYADGATVFDSGSRQIDPGVSGIDSAFTPKVFAIRDDGRQMAVSGGGRLWVADVKDVNEQYNPRELIGSGGADHVGFAGDAGRLVTASGTTVSFWDPGSQPRLRVDTEMRKVPETPSASPATLASTSPDGRRVLLVGGFGDVVLHDMIQGSAEGTRVVVPDGVGDVLPAWLPDGAPVLVGKVGCGLYKVHDGRTETLLEGRGQENVAAKITVDGSRLVCVDLNGGMSSRRISDGTYLDQMPGNAERLSEYSGAHEPGLAAISDDGRYVARIAAGTEESGLLTVVDTENKTTVTVSGASRTVNYVGERLLVSHPNGSLDVRDRAGTELLRSIPGSADFAHPLSGVPNTPFVGRVRNDGVVTVIDVDRGVTLGDLPLPVATTLATARWEATAITGSVATGELITATPEGTVTRWAVNVGAWLASACRFAGRDLRADEWQAVTGSVPPGDLRCMR